jgi:hypothetical protein
MCVSFCRALPTMSHTERSLFLKAALNVDIRNLITHNRGVVNQFFFQRGLSCGARRTNRFRGLLGRCQDSRNLRLPRAAVGPACHREIQAEDVITDSGTSSGHEIGGNDGRH